LVVVQRPRWSLAVEMVTAARRMGLEVEISDSVVARSRLLILGPDAVPFKNAPRMPNGNNSIEPLLPSTSP